MGNHCPEGCVHVTHIVVGRGMFIVYRVFLRLLTQASLPGGPFCRSLRCVVCTSQTAYFDASLRVHCFCSFHFPNQIWARFVFFPHSRGFIDLQTAESQRGTSPLCRGRVPRAVKRKRLGSCTSRASRTYGKMNG